MITDPDYHQAARNMSRLPDASVEEIGRDLGFKAAHRAQFELREMQATAADFQQVGKAWIEQQLQKLPNTSSDYPGVIRRHANAVLNHIFG
jgi:hypothetical protein